MGRMRFSVSASIGARVRVGFAALVVITIVVAVGALTVASESGERAESSVDAYQVLASAERVANATTLYFARRDADASAAVETALGELRRSLDHLDAAAPERIAELTSETERLAESFARARTSDVAIDAKVEDMRAAADGLRAAAAELLAVSDEALEAKSARRTAVEEELTRLNVLDALSLSIRRESTAFVTEFSASLTPEAFPPLRDLQMRLTSMRQALTRMQGSELTDDLAARHAASLEALDALSARFDAFKELMASDLVAFGAFRESRAEVVAAAERMRNAIALLERDIQSIKRNQAQELRASREAADAALQASREGNAFNGATAAMEAKFLEFILDPTDASYAAALGELQPLIEFALQRRSGEENAATLAEINVGVAAFDAGLTELSAAFDERAAALEEMSAAASRFSEIATAFGAAEMGASAEAADAVSAILTWATAAAAVLALVVSWVVSRSIARPVRRITSQMKDVADGDLDVALTDAGRKDEIGEMAAAVEVFRRNGLEMRELAAAQERRDAEAEAARRRMMAELQEAFGGVVDAAALGDHQRRVDARFADPELNAIADGMNRVLETVGGFFSDLKRSLDALAVGDLTGRIENAHDGAFQDMAESANATMSKLAGLIEEIRRASAGIAASTRDMASGARRLSDRTDNQAASLKQTATALDEMRETVGSNAETAEEASALATETRSQAEEGGAVVGEAKEAMARLSDSAARITEITAVIDGIAFQTNLLALNAAVEAARAGASGKGFAVVASEVRALAQRSAEAAKDIKELIEASTRQVDDGVRLVEATRTTLDDISKAIAEVSDRVSHISTATREQSEAVREVSDAVNALGALTEQNAEAAEQSAKSAQVFSAETDRLDELVSTFKLDASDEKEERAA